MKLVSYAGQQVVTTDDVAEALVALAAALASEGESAALRLPIVVDGKKDSADLIVGVGNDLLVGPQTSDGDDPDFSEDAAQIRMHPLFPQRTPGDDEDDGGFGIPAVDIDIEHGTRA
ncbi:hypothetical protein ACIPJ1_08805 [Microbacterium maritypicum]|uniref:Uncharacterized protein n=1 Tax=Microbacterium maritypicum MF109 TaxID=1333857 RepID=T5K2J7_MICMQ|nr:MULTISPECIES: hypothetical protein [Microbacterium]EQM73453.1 hypothetical protein L687_06790 [Microbacterium maritypicum MF109]MCV0334060.1 hypothetical protein [Microbacterium sp.]MCV0374412.1 hypothetical protein [Microbacterium sp.]MCV0389484.1 hypothetical protein [Microbacterium sp.]MCV0419018.1 hypothetical protein [Microbacterium sp.]